MAKSSKKPKPQKPVKVTVKSAAPLPDETPFHKK